MVWSCIGCSRVFDTSKGLGIHQKSCKEYTSTTRKILLKRTQTQERPDPAKLARRDFATSFDGGDDSLDSSGIDVGMSLNPESSLIQTTSSDDHDNLNSPPPSFSTRSRRRVRVPKRFKDFLPSSATPLSHLPDLVPARHGRQPQSSSPSPVEDTDSPVCNREVDTPEEIVTQPNGMGLYRVYTSMPSLDPDDAIGLSDICDSPGLQSPETIQPDHSGDPSPVPKYFAPFLNATIYRLMTWWYGGSGAKSAADLDRLVEDVLSREDFDPKDLEGFRAARECARLDEHENEKITPFPSASGWTECSVKIRLPAEYQTFKDENEAPEYEVPGVFVRNLVDVIRDAFQDPAALTFHMTPFKQFWKPSESAPAQRVFGELYSSDTMLQEHEKIRSAPREPGCHLETTIAAIMLWSDSTHLASFGNASLWPIYAYFGNQSKYTRAKPTSFSAHHLAYIPSLPESFEDSYTSIFDGSPTPDVQTYCKRELVHAIWALLLNPEFMHAYEHGIVIKCTDGVTRRIYPRFFTYSADYPEKVRLATIKYLACCPCPRCLILKDQISDMGNRSDRCRRENIRVDSERRQSDVEMTRSWIFERGYPVSGPQVKAKLGPTSAVPTRNAFSLRLFLFGFNFFSMFVPDLLHEFELGVWKHIFTHLVRILYAIGDNVVQRLNERYRQVPTFGRGTIRRFCTNASEMKKFAGRDFEDLLQCAIPVFEGLLPAPHDALVTDLLFVLATWHASAKLRLHTETTLAHLDDTTTLLGQVLRKFIRMTCNAFVTRELPREEAARTRRRLAAQTTKKRKAPRNADSLNQKSSTKKAASTTPSTTPSSASRGRKLFNLCTYTLHALADYAKTIRQFGTSDSYSTQVGELEHRRVKRFYSRTNKNRFTSQITKHESRERKLRKIRLRQATAEKENPNSAARAPATTSGSSTKRKAKPVSLDFTDSDPMPYTDPTVHYHMSQSTRYYENITKWLGDNADDPATENFLPRLQDHILARLLEIPYDGDEHNFSDSDRRTVTFVNNRIYKHKVIRINYTTYDVRRMQDSLNPRVHADFLCLSHEDQAGPNPHPYWYGRIIGIFHALVRHVGPRSKSTDIQRVDFLWVRWFGRDLSHCGGWNKKRLHRLGFLLGDGEGAFGFLDPNEIIRAAHLIPGFAYGRTTEIMGHSIARRDYENDEDWNCFYVNPFVDRDMFMRFLGGGIGHKAQECPTNLTSDVDMAPEADPNELDDGEDGVGDDSVIRSLSDQLELEASDGEEDEDSEEYEHGSMEDEIEKGDCEDTGFSDPEDGEGAGEDFLAMEGYGEL